MPNYTNMNGSQKQNIVFSVEIPHGQRQKNEATMKKIGKENVE